MTIAEGFPCIDLYARPRKTRLKHERLNLRENMWIGGALLLVLLAEGIVVHEHMELAAQIRGRLNEIARSETQKAGFERTRSGFVVQAEKTRGIENRLAARTGWLRLMQAVSSVTTDRDVLEQCTVDGKVQRAVLLAGSAQDLTELQGLLQRLKALRCMKSVRLMETAADKSLGPESIHFRIEARCDATELNKETIAK